MPVSKAKLESNARYREKQAFIQIRVTDETRERYKAKADKDEKSLNAMIITAIEEYITNHGL